MTTTIDPIRVVFVSSHARAGGAERYLTTLIEALGAEWIASVVSLEFGPLVEDLRRRGIAAAVVPTGPGPASIVRSALRLRRHLAKTDAAVVHANGVKAALVSVLATFGTHLPVVWVKHDFSWDGRLTRLIAGRCRTVVGVSAAVVETFGPQGRSGKVHVVHNGLPAVQPDRERGRRLVAETLGLETAGVVLGLVGRLDPGKGQHELIAVLPDLVRQMPEVKVRVALVGARNPDRPDYASELRAALTREGLADVVSFLGFREDAVELISGFDVLVVPSVADEKGFGREGFGYVGLEAFAVGTPVVAYDDGALRETLGECALLVRAGDRAALRDGLVRVLGDPELRERLVRCGRERLEGRFSIETMVESMQEHYRRAAR